MGIFVLEILFNVSAQKQGEGAQVKLLNCKLGFQLSFLNYSHIYNKVKALNVQMHIMSLCLSALKAQMHVMARNAQRFQSSYRGCKVAADEREQKREVMLRTDESVTDAMVALKLFTWCIVPARRTLDGAVVLVKDRSGF